MGVVRALGFDRREERREVGTAAGESHEEERSGEGFGLSVRRRAGEGGGSRLVFL
jgi:hypothetical protein